VPVLACYPMVVLVSVQICADIRLVPYCIISIWHCICFLRHRKDWQSSSIRVTHIIHVISIFASCTLCKQSA
jgi:hypothetical protein